MADGKRPVDSATMLSSLKPLIERIAASPDHPLHTKFAKLTQQEEKHGLLNETATIGTRAGWQTRLTETGFRLNGHRLVREKR